MVNTKKIPAWNIWIRSLAESCFTSDGESISMAARDLVQASSRKPQATEIQAASDKHQATSSKRQASSRKRQALQFGDLRKVSSS